MDSVFKNNHGLSIYVGFQSVKRSSQSYREPHLGNEFKDFSLGFYQSSFLCTILKCIEFSVKCGIPSLDVDITKAWNPLIYTPKFWKCASWNVEIVLILWNCYELVHVHCVFVWTDATGREGSVKTWEQTIRAKLCSPDEWIGSLHREPDWADLPVSRTTLSKHYTVANSNLVLQDKNLMMSIFFLQVRGWDRDASL